MPLDMSDITRELGNLPPILGLVGPLGCGKTTTADAIAARVRGKRQSCAGPIRDMLAALGVPREDLTQHKNKPQEWLHGLTSRAMLKSLGTEWGRTYVGPDIWINAVLRAAAQEGARGRPIVIDDIRFDNEARAIKEAGGHLLFVYHYGIDYSYAHPSECGLSDWSLLDGLINVENGWVVAPSMIEALGYDDIVCARPWWARWAWGRRLFGSKQPPTASGKLRHPDEIATRVVEHWNLLTRGGATDHARRTTPVAPTAKS